MRMKIATLILALAMPIAAHAAEPAPKKECCCKGEDGKIKMKCCDDMKAEKKGADAHAGHDMSGSERPK